MVFEASCRPLSGPKFQCTPRPAIAVTVTLVHLRNPWHSHCSLVSSYNVTCLPLRFTDVHVIMLSTKDTVTPTGSLSSGVGVFSSCPFHQAHLRAKSLAAAKLPLTSTINPTPINDQPAPVPAPVMSNHRESPPPAPSAPTSRQQTRTLSHRVLTPTGDKMTKKTLFRTSSNGAPTDGMPAHPLTISVSNSSLAAAAAEPAIVKNSRLTEQWTGLAADGDTTRQLGNAGVNEKTADGCPVTSGPVSHSVSVKTTGREQQQQQPPPHRESIAAAATSQESIDEPADATTAAGGLILDATTLSPPHGQAKHELLAYSHSPTTTEPDQNVASTSRSLRKQEIQSRGLTIEGPGFHSGNIIINASSSSFTSTVVAANELSLQPESQEQAQPHASPISRSPGWSSTANAAALASLAYTLDSLSARSGHQPAGTELPTCPSSLLPTTKLASSSFRPESVSTPSSPVRLTHGGVGSLRFNQSSSHHYDFAAGNHGHSLQSTSTTANSSLESEEELIAIVDGPSSSSAASSHDLIPRASSSLSLILTEREREKRRAQARAFMLTATMRTHHPNFSPMYHPTNSVPHLSSTNPDHE